MNCKQNTCTDEALKEKLEALLRECKTEGDLRERCQAEFAGFRDLKVSFLPTIRIANLYIAGRQEPVYLVVHVG